jgi:NodT family efflux transporter outer membrane factor (OMF) lipoprotein
MMGTYKRPTTPVPAAFRDTPGDAANLPGPAPDWWRAFGSPPLDAMMIEATKNNQDLAAAVARIREADAQLRIAGATLLPTVDAGASGTRQKTPGTQFSRPKVSNSFAVNLSASYEIDFWGKNAAGVAAAQASAQASRFDRQVIQLTTQASVATTEFDLLGTGDRLRAAQESLRESEDLLAAERDRLKLGTATDLDVAQQESVVATARAAIPPFEQQIRQDANALAVLLGKSPETEEIDVGSLDALSIPGVAPGLPSSLLERRPDVREAEANLVAANANIAAARAAFYPSISLTGQLGFESAMLSTLLNPVSQLASIGASLTQPIFHGGALQGNLELTQAQQDELIATYRGAVLAALQDVENALIAVRKTAEEEESQRVAVTTAQRAYRLATDQLTGGVTDITTVLNTEKTLFQAQDARAQARLAHVQAVVALFKALGGGWNGQV